MEGKSMKDQKVEVILGSKGNMNPAWTTQDYVSTRSLTLKKESIYSIWKTEEELTRSLRTSRLYLKTLTQKQNY